MKKTILIIALFIAANFNVQAQDDAFKKDAIKLVEMNSKAVEASLAQVYMMIPEDKVEAFKKELNPVLKEFYVKLAEKSMDFYTHEEVKQILDFYESEIGQKHIEVQGEMTKASMGPMAQELQTKLMPLVQKYMQ